MTNTTHQQLSVDFNSFCFNFNKINPDEHNIKDDTHTRVLINRLYYALYHRLLSHFSNLSTNTGTNKHEAIGKALEKNAPNANVTRLFFILKDLRVWADYELNNQPSFEIRMDYLMQQTYRAINQRGLS